MPQAGQRRELEEGRVAVEQQLDALARQQLAALAVALDVLLAAAGARQRELLVEVGDLLEKRRAVGPVGLGARIDVAAQDFHRLPGSQPVGPSRARRGCRPFAWPMNGGCTL